MAWAMGDKVVVTKLNRLHKKKKSNLNQLKDHIMILSYLGGIRQRRFILSRKCVKSLLSGSMKLKI